LNIKYLCSGMQVGADLAAWTVAKELNIPFTGYVPYGYKTKYGTLPDRFRDGVVEHSSAEYKPRTYKNVEISCATIRFAYDFQSAGEVCTLNAIKKYNKPHFDIDLSLLET